MTEIEAKQIVATLFAAFPVETRNIPADEAKATAKIYAASLMDIDSAVASQAADRLRKSAERFPSIAKIRATCVEIAHGRKRPGGDAWGDVTAAIRRHGYIRAPGVDFKFDDPLVARAVEAFGWRALCESENPVADRARFCQLYDALDDSERTGAQLASGARSDLLRTGDEPRRLERATGALPIADALKKLTGGKP